MNNKSSLLHERIEKSVQAMYKEDDLSSCPLFKGGFINWGYYDQIDISKKLTVKDRIRASKRLYEISAAYLGLKHNDKFLEVCCGRGSGLSFLQNKYSLKDITGIDQNGFYIDCCKKAMSNGVFVVSDAEILNLRGKFNKILSIEAIQHLKDIKRFLTNISSLLEEGGVAVIASFFGTIDNAKELVSKDIQTVKDGIDILHNIEEIKEYLFELDLSFEVLPIGEKVFLGFDKWTAQTSLKDSWTRNWLKAFERGFLNYFIIKIRKNLCNKNPIDSSIKEYKKGKLEKYEYIRRMHHINRNLHYIAKHLKYTDIEKIEISATEGLLFTTKKDGLKLNFSGLDRRGAPFEILNFGSYEEGDNFILFNLIQDGDTIFDVGSNIGWYSALFSKKFPMSKIYAFEPIAETFQFLKKNIHLNNCHNVLLNNCGISNKNGSVKFYYFPEGSIIASQKNLIDCVKAREVCCKIITLDEFVEQSQIEKLDMLKCDIEGGELYAIEGGLKALKKFKPKILMELCHRWTSAFGYHPNDIIQKFAEIGYKCFSPENNYLLEIDSLNENIEEEKLNYFFLHKIKHKNIIRKLSAF
jgi:FkbM family methyltransferase